ncbi:hypothetical protein ACH5RR_039823 [Cinchona calisaya]|uniref:Disease resistance N-terminal domain-containing protein n=1 Tax=Cinchona calisaya TaxID=153742 RepID=A0ABD2Y3F3_9GENT
MVDSLVSATVQVLLDKAISLATDRIGLVFGFKKDMESLRGSAAMIASVLADADDKQRHNRAIQLWLQRLEQVAFDADNDIMCSMSSTKKLFVASIVTIP